MGNTNQVVRYFYDKVIGGSKLGNKKASSKGSLWDKSCSMVWNYLKFFPNIKLYEIYGYSYIKFHRTIMTMPMNVKVIRTDKSEEWQSLQNYMTKGR